ncbi:MAG: phospholipase D-like domain-containing protein [Candidatus Micrarchaeaceae archaeon]
MFGFRNNGAVPPKVYSGNEGYKHVERLFHSSRSIDIITPYIGIQYAKMLYGLAGSGKRIRIIIAKGQDSNSAAISYLGPKVHSNIQYSLASAVSFIAFVLLYLMGLPYEAFILLLLFLLFTFLALRRAPQNRNIYVRYAPGFVHEKIYIGDNEAITGSANLTYSGMHKNTEYLEVIRDSDRIEALEKHFNTLWNGSSNI